MSASVATIRRRRRGAGLPCTSATVALANIKMAASRSAQLRKARSRRAAIRAFREALRQAGQGAALVDVVQAFYILVYHRGWHARYARERRGKNACPRCGQPVRGGGRHGRR